MLRILDRILRRNVTVNDVKKAADVTTKAAKSVKKAVESNTSTYSQEVQDIVASHIYKIEPHDVIYSQAVVVMDAIESRVDEYVEKDQDWNIEFREGVIYFGEDEYDFQYIGSESYAIQTWMWGWNNINGFDDIYLELVKNTKSKMDFQPFQTAEVPINKEINGHTYAKISCYLAEEDYFYFKANNGNQAAYLAIEGGPEELYAPLNAQEFVEIIQHAASTYTIDHKIAVEALTKFCKGTITETGVNIGGTDIAISYNPEDYDIIDIKIVA